MNETTTPHDNDEYAQLVLDGLQAGAAIKDLHGVSEDMLEGVYAYAHRFYSNGELDKAETFFRFLCLYDFYNGEYALGLGAVYQMQRHYQKAIDMYAVAFALTRADYRPMLHVGQCHLALGRLVLAGECFQSVIAHGKDAALSERAQVYLQAMDAANDARPVPTSPHSATPDSA